MFRLGLGWGYMQILYDSWWCNVSAYLQYLPTCLKDPYLPRWIAEKKFYVYLLIPAYFQCLAIELLLFLSPAMRSW